MLEFFMKKLYFALFLLLPTIGYSQIPCPGLDSINYSSQWYHTVQIGSQCWLKENMNVGIVKPAVKDQTNNDTIEKFCYNNDPAMCDIYGGLYQWREAMQYTKKEKARGICPIGWHIPSYTEFNTLTLSVNMDGNALKEIGQGEGTNTSGFSALLSGVNKFSSFYLLGNESVFWSSNIVHIANELAYTLNAENMGLGTGSLIDNDANIYNGMYGLNIRCLKDDDRLILQLPSGTESWQVGTSHNISWGGDDITNKKIKIEYTTDNGIIWLDIIGSTPALNGNYLWSIPNTNSKYCKVKITDIDNPSLNRISDTTFTIYTYCPGGPTVEHGGKTYNTILIGNQCWLKENINVGNMIPGDQESTANSIIEKYCYNDDTANCSIYGGLYKYSEIGEEGLCPTFWHVAGLVSLVDQVLYDGNSLKEIGQGSGFGAGTNLSKFSALFSGYRGNDGLFHDLGNTTWFPYTSLNSHLIVADFLDNSSVISWTDHFGSNTAGSVRCVRNEVGPLLLQSPVGGESWQIGSTQKISWTLSDVINIKLEYTTDNGSNWITIITSTPTSVGNYSWTIPNTPSLNCKVRISSVNDPDSNSVSNFVFTIFQVASTPCPGLPTINYGGQSYRTIAIGEQCWLKENLNIGTQINGNLNQTNNNTIEKYCYNDDTSNCTKYGGLYQWAEAMQYNSLEGTEGICPVGWHVPTRNDFTILRSIVNNNGNDLKAIGQGSGTNASGFSALLAGILRDVGFGYLNSYGFFWSSTNYNSTMAYNLSLSSGSTVYFSPGGSYFGNSIRCLNDLIVSDLPVELISFTAFLIGNSIMLNWNTATEINTSSFEIEKKKVNNDYWLKIASLKASGNSTFPKQYSYTDKNANTGKYNYRLKMVDLDGSYKYSNIINVEIASPSKFELSNAYPNPWNPSTTIRYQLPFNILVTIKIFDALGKEVATLVNEVNPAGSYEVTFNGQGLVSGVYYYQMRAGNFRETKKIILIK
jgi:uncharacterized protein (TIGR02145 family)